MAYTATTYLSFKPFFHPRGQDMTQRNFLLSGWLATNDTAEYTPGGIGSTSFQVTAFSAVGLVTYNTLIGAPLYNGQRVVLYNFASNTNDGTYIVSSLTTTSATAGTFVAVPLTGKALAASAQTSQTAEGVGQLQFGTRYSVSQTFTATAVTVSGNQMTVSYTTLVGPQLTPNDNVTLAGMTNAGNNGTFSLQTVLPTSGTNQTAGKFIVTNAAAVATDSGTGTGNFIAGIEVAVGGQYPTLLEVNTVHGYVYVWDTINYTVRIFQTGASGSVPLVELGLGATWTWDPTLTTLIVVPKYFPQ